MRTVAALYVDPRGPYFGLPGVDPCDEMRDARLYAGPHPVVAHPPCERWGRFWSADGSSRPGEDGGLFEGALAAVEAWGGVLEHPEGSHAWRRFDLPEARLGVWSRGVWCSGWSTCVAQRCYGHRARKLTWLYYVGDAPPPPLDWTDPGSGGVYLSQPGRCRSDKPRPTCPCRRCAELYGDLWRGAREFERMGAEENRLTPPPFVELLLAMARAARPMATQRERVA